MLIYQVNIIESDSKLEIPSFLSPLNIYALISRIIINKQIIYGLIYFASFSFIFVSIIPSFIGYDGYFHWRYSSISSQKGFSFEALPLTIYQNDFIDHHWLFHKTLSFITVVGDEYGPRIGRFTFLYLFIVIYWLVSNKLGVKHSLFWTFCCMLLSNVMLYRLALLRVNALSITFYLLCLYFLLNYKYKMILITMYLYTLFYYGSIIFLINSGFYAILNSQNKFIFYTNKCFLYCLIGFALGLILTPYFPDNIFFLMNYVMSRLNWYNPTLSINVEWNHMGVYDICLWLLPYIFFFFFILIAKIFYYKKNKFNNTDTFLFISSLLFFLAILRYVRMIEYFIPTFCLFSSIVINRQINKDKYLYRMFLNVKMICILIFIINFYMLVTSVNNNFLIRDNEQRKSLEWIAKNSNDGDFILNFPYSSFPALYFNQPYAQYVNGLEPDFLRRQNESVYNKLDELASSRDHTLVPIQIQGKKIDFVYISRINYSLSYLLISNFINSAYYELCYKDESAYIFCPKEVIANED